MTHKGGKHWESFRAAREGHREALLHPCGQKLQRDAPRAAFGDQSSRTTVQRHCPDISQGCPLNLHISTCLDGAVPCSPGPNSRRGPARGDWEEKLSQAWDKGEMCSLPGCRQLPRACESGRGSTAVDSSVYKQSSISLLPPLLIIAQNTPSKIHTHNNPLEKENKARSVSARTQAQKRSAGEYSIDTIP